MGMTAGVIGVTAGVAGANTGTTSTKVLTAHTATAVPSTATSTTLSNTITVTLGANITAVTGSTVALDMAAPTAGGTATFDTTAPTCATTRSADVTCLASITASTHKVLTIALTTTTTVASSVKSALTVTLTGTHVATTAAHGAIDVSSPAGSGWAAASAVTIANAPLVGPSTGNGITASSAPMVAKTGTAQKAGTLTITLRGTTATATATSFLNLTTTVGNGTTNGHAYWNSATVTGSGVNAAATTNVPSSTNVTNTELTIKLGHLPAGNSATVHVTGVKYNTITAVGTVTVTPKWVNTMSNALATATYGTFTPTSAVNAVATHKTPAAPGVTALVATSTPYVGRGSTGAAAGNWTATETASATPTTAKSEGWTKTTTITITVAPDSLTNCTTATNYVLVTGTPTATVGTTKTVSATPTVSVSTAAALPCTVNDHNVVSVTFTNSGTFTGATGTFSIMLSGVKYDVGKTTTTGNVKVGAKFTTTGATIHVASTTGATATTPANSGPSNADVTKLYVSANTPAVTLAPNAFDAAISPINSIEALPAQIPVSYVCVSLAAGNVFNTSASATAKVTKGTGTVTSKVSYETSAGVKATTTANAGTAGYARFKVTKESVTTATTYSLSGLKVNASGTAGTVTATVKYVSTATTCAAGGTSIGSATAYSILSAPPNQIYGQTADATAAKLLQTRFSTTTGHCIDTTVKTTSAANRPVILATTEHYQDALARQYLASYLHTGTLLTPTAALSAVTLQALKFEGITQVFVVGGPLVVSTAVIAQLMTTPAYSCGGGSKLLTGTGATRFLSVTRIYGQTAVETARDIAESAPTTHVASLSFTTAYLGVNATKGNGAFNDTAGSGSPVPLSAAASKTAILASTTEFQDAMAASALSYWQTGGQGVSILLTNPFRLSSAAQGAIATLGIKQVILMGGQLAVTNSVVTSLESLGISVLRVAGHTYTDTATQLAKFEESKPGMGLNWDTHVFAVARGNGFTDALVGADVAGKVPEPMLLTTSPTAVGKYLTAFLKAHGAKGTAIDTVDGKTLTKFTVFGGPLAVSPAVVSQMETDIS